MLKSSDNQFLIDRLIKENDEFRLLYDEHIKFEQDLEALYSIQYIPLVVEDRIKEIKIMKLRGKDRMLQIMTNIK